MRRANEAARAQLWLPKMHARLLSLTLVSDVASDYFTLLQLDLQLAITRETVDPDRFGETYPLRLDHGVATKLDVLRRSRFSILRMRRFLT